MASKALLERTIHDLKNPLAVVRASLEWLEIEVADRVDAVDAVRDASVATARLLRIVDDLDMLVQLEAGRALAREALDIRTMVGEVGGSAESRLAPRGIAVALVVTTDATVSGDARLVKRAIESLVDATARVAFARSSIEIEARAKAGAGAGAGAIELEVGLAGAVANGTDDASLDELSSGGLSLYLALAVATAHGGSLRIVRTQAAPRLVMQLPAE